MFNQLKSFKSLTLSEYLFICQAVSAMSNKGVKVINAFFKHAYQGQWHLACYRYQYRGNVMLPCSPHKEEYINNESDLIREGNEIVGVRASLYSNDGAYLIYDGFWKDHKFHGTGTHYPDSKECYEGMFVNGQRDGWGEEFDSNGVRRFEGQFKNGKKEGRCTIFYNNGLPMFKGSIKPANNEDGYIKEGNDCEEYNSSGFLLYRGRYKDNQRYGEGEVYRSPHYVQEVAYYGEYNSGVGVISYQYIPNCNLEDITAGDKVNFIYDKVNRKDTRDENTKLFAPLLEDKAYFCRR